MEKYKEIQNTVKKGFSGKTVQKAYEEMTKEGLWKSEEILFKKYFKKNSTILDIGCGSGRTTFPLLRMKYNVKSIDLTPAMIRTAKKISKEYKINADFEVGDATCLRFRDSGFDNAIFSFNGWDQIPGEENRQKALSEASRVIKKGGYFIFTSHHRTFKRFFFFWTVQWIKMYILKPIGFKIKEIEFGDRFFKKASIEEYENEQFIHIPSLKKINEQIKNAGFELMLNEYRNNISPIDAELKSLNCMFFVCRKK